MVAFNPLSSFAASTAAVYVDRCIRRRLDLDPRLDRDDDLAVRIDDIVAGRHVSLIVARDDEEIAAPDGPGQRSGSML